MEPADDMSTRPDDKAAALDDAKRSRIRSTFVDEMATMLLLGLSAFHAGEHTAEVLVGDITDEPRASGAMSVALLAIVLASTSRRPLPLPRYALVLAYLGTALLTVLILTTGTRGYLG